MAIDTGLAHENGDILDFHALGDHPHAMFTKEYRIVPDASPDHPSRQAFDDLVGFFNQHSRKQF